MNIKYIFCEHTQETAILIPPRDRWILNMSFVSIPRLQWFLYHHVTDEY